MRRHRRGKKGIVENQKLLSNPGDTTDPHSIVIFRIGCQIYGLPIEPILQIIPMVAITPIPQGNGLVEGVITVRGQIAAVINLARHLGLSDDPPQFHSPILLLQIGERMVGLIVEEVMDVLQLTAERILHLPEQLTQTPHNPAILYGLTYTPDGDALLVNPNLLFHPSQLDNLSQAIDVLENTHLTIHEEEQRA